MTSNSKRDFTVKRMVYTVPENHNVPAKSNESVVIVQSLNLPTGSMIVSVNVLTYNQQNTSRLIPVVTQWYSTRYIDFINPTDSAISAPAGLQLEVFYI